MRAWRRARPGWFAVTLAVALALVLCFLVLPLVALLVHTTPARLVASLGDAQARDALWLSARVTLMAMALIVVLGTPAAFGLATRRFRGRAALVTLIELPLVLPPAVAGIALLSALGPGGLLGPLLESSSIELVLQTAGVVAALAFVAGAFYVRQAHAAFAGVDPGWLEASRTLGASEARTFVRVAVPAAMPGLLAGGALALGRALGEFGATLIFAGSFRGITQTMPLAIYDRFATDLDGALALSCVLVAASASILAAVKLAGGAEALGGAAR